MLCWVLIGRATGRSRFWIAIPCRVLGSQHPAGSQWFQEAALEMSKSSLQIVLNHLWKNNQLHASPTRSCFF